MAEPQGSAEADSPRLNRRESIVRWRVARTFNDRPFRGGPIGPSLQRAAQTRLIEILRERAGQQPPIVSVDHAKADAGTHLLDLTLRPRHIIRLNERLSVPAEDEVEVDYAVDFDLDRLGYQQERALQAFSAYVNRSTGTTKPLWIPILRPIRSTAPPPSLSYDGSFVDSMQQRDIRPLLANALFRLLGDFIFDGPKSTQQWSCLRHPPPTGAPGTHPRSFATEVLSGLDPPNDEQVAQNFAIFQALSRVWMDRPEVRWRLYEAIWLLIRNGLPRRLEVTRRSEIPPLQPKPRFEPIPPGASAAKGWHHLRSKAPRWIQGMGNDQGSVTELAVQIATQVLILNRAWLDLLVLASTEGLVIAGIPTDALRGRVDIRGSGFASIERGGAATVRLGAEARIRQLGYPWIKRSQLPFGRPVC